MLTPAWGLTPSANAIAAWGARALYHENPGAYAANHTKRGTPRKRNVVNYFEVELLGDRQEVVGDEANRKFLLKWLKKVGIPRLIKECNERRLPRDSDAFVEFTADGHYTLKATPRKSGGYLYIGAWVNP